MIHSKCSVRTPKFLRICPARFPKPHSKFQSGTIYVYNISSLVSIEFVDSIRKLRRRASAKLLQTLLTIGEFQTQTGKEEKIFVVQAQQLTT